jgi:hypothetical protein
MPSWSMPLTMVDVEVAMPWVKEHTRSGKKVRSYYRLNSKWNFWFGLFLLVLLFGIYHKSR